ncbi:uncharacterized protein [Physcomitrium patens]|uniref:FAS1 domain-containing protein n=1 Tax=Physcomitrium patens TaxID=3218 RepID=A0A2K1JLA0_PHYPA|nr:fasciclin-like arabinogalactan protein 7 [Physcomitrium patens]XP_024391900.1 fasciclin-like arabinogalactan protein 7 [Physcomitrium patens]PNR42289.1 hypothetical protein PHYPA_017118 [Physcomitrium patens]|eukprot:XP_024391899.1 fasciclin-like arabinogalactan protein 7 [Physcomitrella patens]
MAGSHFFRPGANAWVLLASIVCCALLVSAELADDSPTKAAIAAAPAPLIGAPAPAPVAPPPKPLTLHEKVVAALRAAGHYGAISGLLDSLGEASSIIKEGVTLFAPDDGAFSGLNLNSSKLLMTTLDYHVATSVYNYNQLSTLPLNSTIKTSVPDVVILITSTGTSGLRLDNVAISDPDLYVDSQIAVHGISAVMDTAKYNKGVVPPEAAPAPLATNPSPAPGLITTPTTPRTASPAGTGNGAAHVLTNIVSTMLLVSAVSFLIALL